VGGGVLALIKRQFFFATSRECFDWLEREGLWKNNRHLDGTEEVVVDTFYYHDHPDRGGVLRYKIERIEFKWKSNGAFALNKDGKHQKKFKQWQPNPKKPGEWIPNVDGCPLLLYNLQEVIEAIGAGHLIVVVEGEGKVNLLWSWNVPATCNSGGAKNWKKEHAEFLRGADVLILGDNDET